MSVVMLVSGGVDSTVLAALYVEKGIRVWPLFIDYGQLAAEREWSACRTAMAKLGLDEPARMNLSGYGDVVPSGLTKPDLDLNRDAFLPARNLMMLVAASGYAFSRGAVEVVIGLVDGDARLFPDQSLSFLKKAEEAIAEALGLRISITAPLIGLRKQDVLILFAGLRAIDTYSCHRGEATPCGECVACQEIQSATGR